MKATRENDKEGTETVRRELGAGARGRVEQAKPACREGPTGAAEAARRVSFPGLYREVNDFVSTPSFQTAHLRLLGLLKALQLISRFGRLEVDLAGYR